MSHTGIEPLLDRRVVARVILRQNLCDVTCMDQRLSRRAKRNLTITRRVEIRVGDKSAKTVLSADGVDGGKKSSDGVRGSRNRASSDVRGGSRRGTKRTSAVRARSDGTVLKIGVRKGTELACRRRFLNGSARLDRLDRFARLDLYGVARRGSFDLFERRSARFRRLDVGRKVFAFATARDADFLFAIFDVSARRDARVVFRVGVGVIRRAALVATAAEDSSEESDALTDDRRRRLILTRVRSLIARTGRARAARADETGAEQSLRLNRLNDGKNRDDKRRNGNNFHFHVHLLLKVTFYKSNDLLFAVFCCFPFCGTSPLFSLSLLATCFEYITKTSKNNSCFLKI